MIRYSALIILFFIAAVALADDQVNGAGSPYWTKTQALSTTSACISDVAIPSRCALFAAGTSPEHESKVVVVINEGDTAVTCAWVGNGSATLTGTVIADTGGEYGDSGAGASFRLIPQKVIRWDAQPRRSASVAGRSVGTWPGLCSNTTRLSGELVHAPCRENSHCTLYNGGTCNLTPTETQKMYASTRLVCEADSGTPTILILKDFVPKEPIAGFGS